MKTVIEMACEAGTYSPDNPDDYAFSVKELERFAALVAAAEREACAQMIEEMKGCSQYFPHVPDALRAREQA